VYIIINGHFKNHHHWKKKRTITTGPFFIPVNNISLNDRLIVIIKNPTNRALEASIEIERSSIAEDPAASITQFPTINTTPETPLGVGIPMTPIPAHSCHIFETDISTLRGTTILRVTSTGDYAVGEDKPKCGKLEIAVIGGTGRTTQIHTPLPGLNLSDPSLLFRYENFVVCDKDDHDDKCTCVKVCCDDHDDKSKKRICCDDHDHDHKFKKRIRCCDDHDSRFKKKIICWEEPTHPDKDWFC
jgi:hypothetical protein